MTAQILAIAGQKGGIAKTTTARNVGAELAALGYRVLLVDADHQASLTAICKCEPTDATLYDVLLVAASGTDEPFRRTAIYPLSSGEWLLPGDILLANADTELNNVLAREQLLAAILEPLRTTFDYILIDCPPSLGLLTINALTAADAVLMPIPAKYLDARGLDQLLGIITGVRKRLNRKLRLAGAVVTFWEPRLVHQQGMMEQIIAFTSHKHLPLLGTIRKTTKADEAAEAGKPIREMADANGGAADYSVVTAALLAQEGMHARET